MGKLVKKRPAKSAAPKRLRVGCAFCWEWLPAPRQIMTVFSGEGAVGGRCECGACFVIDEIGRAGGQALLDAQALVCDGDLERAIKLRRDVDVEVKTRDIDARASVEARGALGFGLARAKVWFAKLK